MLEEHFLNPRNVGKVDDPSATGRAGSLTCGAVLIVTLKIDNTHQVTDALFKAAGCSRLVSACSVLTEIAKGKSTAKAAIQAQEIETTLNAQLGLPPEGKDHCAALAGEAMLMAIRSYSDSIRNEWSGDEALICTCFGVAEGAIEREVRLGHLSTIAEVTAACKAGAGCGSCHSLIQDMLDTCDFR